VSFVQRVVLPSFVRRDGWKGNHPSCPTGGFPQDSGRYQHNPAPHVQGK
jgi:hypothetical protein